MTFHSRFNVGRPKGFLPASLPVWYRYCTVSSRRTLGTEELEAGATPEAQPPSTIAERRLEAIRMALSERRRALGMSMSGLAREVGISPSMVSQIERGQTLPSVATLFALAAALGADIDIFFEGKSGSEQDATAASPATPGAPTPVDASSESPTRERLYVVRKAARESLEIRGGIRWERLTPLSLELLEFLELVYAPRAESDASLYRHPGIEMMLVLRGAFEIHVGFELYRLEEGDSILFSSSLPHRYVNV